MIVSVLIVSVSLLLFAGLLTGRLSPSTRMAGWAVIGVLGVVMVVLGIVSAGVGAAAGMRWLW